jgi:spermidine/putrescine-binding protein
MPLTRRRTLQGLAALAAPALLGHTQPAQAQSAFAGEGLVVVSWSGNHELNFRALVVDACNAKFGTSVETVGGWDQMVSQIVAATFSLFSLVRWDKFGVNWEALDTSMKQTIAITTAG